MVQANWIHMQKLPFASELDITLMFFVIITCHLIITQALKYIFDLKVDSNFVFYLNLILFFMIMSNLFRMITINGLRFSIHKMYIYCSLIYVIVLFVLFFGFREFLFFNFDREFQKMNAHLSEIFSEIYHDEPLNLSFELFLMISIFLSGLFVFILLPSIARFGENYVKIIAQYYSLEQKEKKSTINPEAPEQTTAESLQTAKKASEQLSKASFILKLFNLRLILNLLILFFWIKPMMLPWVGFIGTEETLGTLRLLVALSYSALVAYAYKYEIEIHFTKIYETLKTLLVDPGEENFRKVYSRVTNLLQTSLIISYIIISKFLIPLIIIYIAVYKSNFGNHGKNNLALFLKYQNVLLSPQINLTHTQRTDVLLYAADWNCVGSRKFTDIAYLTSHCAMNPKLELKDVGLNFGAFKCRIDSQGDLMKIVKEIMRKINVYGLIPEEFHLNVLSFWLFNYFLANYGLSIFYILFLRQSQNV